MSLQFKIPGADFSASALPKFKAQVQGFDAENLHALWLFENGALNDAIAIAVDSSGNGNNGTLVAGSVTPTKLAAGVKASVFSYEVPNRPWFSTPFTWVMVMRHELAKLASGTQYPNFWRNKSDLNGGSIANPGIVNPTFVLNNELRGSDIEAGSPMRVALFGSTPGPVTAAGARINVVSSSDIPFDAYWTFALSYDPASNIMIMARDLRIGGVTTRADLNVNMLDAQEARSGSHLFGASKNNISGVSENNPNGTLCLVAMYNSAYNAANLEALRAKAAARVTTRGVTVY